MLEIRHLKTLLALKDTGGYAKAADVLCITQSAVSHQIKALELFYETEIVGKQGGVLYFSPVGERLLELARNVIKLKDEFESDLTQIISGTVGPLRVAVECHTCFDWLMPSMDAYRAKWPKVELDIVSGFHSDPVGLLSGCQAEVAIVSEPTDEPDVVSFPLFEFETVGVVPSGSDLAMKPFLTPQDFEQHKLISYPVPDQMLDVIRLFLAPAGVQVDRRSSELTVALLQLVASGRGISALPVWAVWRYVQRGYVAQVRLGKTGLTSQLYAAVPKRISRGRYVDDFIQIMRAVSLQQLEGVSRFQNRSTDPEINHLS